MNAALRDALHEAAHSDRYVCKYLKGIVMICRIVALCMFCFVLGCRHHSPVITQRSRGFSSSDIAPLNISEDQVPEPENIPYTDPDDIASYLEYYKKAYVLVANHESYGFSVTCCLMSSVPNRNAKINGHYNGMSAGRKARSYAYSQKRKENITRE